MFLLMPVFLLGLFFPSVFVSEILHFNFNIILMFSQITVLQSENRIISLVSNTFVPCLALGFLLTSYDIDTLFYLLHYKIPEGRNLVQYNYISSPYRVYQYLEHSS